MEGMEGAKTQRHGDKETRRHGDGETETEGGAEAEIQIDTETRRPRDTETRPRACTAWLRTNAVNTNGAAAKIMNFDRLEKKVCPVTFGRIKVS